MLKNSKTIPFLVTESEIKETDQKYSERWNTALKVGGIQKFHHFSADPTSKNFILARLTSCSEEYLRKRVFDD